MNKRQNIEWTVKLIGLISGLLVVTPAAGLSTDRDKPIEIEADAAELDDRTGITVYKGNVVVIQGSMHLYGSQLTILYNDDNTLKTATMVGQPAKFRQMPDNASRGEIDGKGIKIEYLASQDRLILTEDAELTQSGKLFRAYKIEYDTQQSKMIARKAEAGETTPSGKAAGQDTGRIKVILPPKKKE